MKRSIRSPRTRQARTPSFDTLEGRALMCGGDQACLEVVGDIVLISGTDGPDRVAVTQDDAGTVTVRIGRETTVLPAEVRYLYASLGGGNDVFTSNSTLPIVVHGGPGTDVLRSFPRGPIVDEPGFGVLYGDEGRDVLAGDPTNTGLIQDNDPVGEFVVSQLGGNLIIYNTPADDFTEVFQDEEGIVHILLNGVSEFLTDPALTPTIVIDGAGGDDTLEVETNAVEVVDVEAIC